MSLLGIKDSSGLTFYYTEKLRKYDAGVFSVGITVTPWFIIPPKQKNWVSVGYCMHQCTEVIAKNPFVRLLFSQVTRMFMILSSKAFN